jgi:hypothetical protein
MSNFTQKPMFDVKEDSRGVWIINFKRAKKANTDELKKKFYEEMIFLSEEFPCAKCRKHMQNYIKDNPFELSMNITVGNEDISCFKYLVGLKNSVNMKLGKPIMSLETALNLYDPSNIAACTVGCDDSDDEKEQEKEQPNKKIIQKEPIVKIENNKPIRIVATKK